MTEMSDADLASDWWYLRQDETADEHRERLRSDPRWVQHAGEQTPEEAEQRWTLIHEAASVVQGLDPAAGHAWRITAEHVGSHGLARTAEDGSVQTIGHDWALWMAQPWVLTVQAWSLKAALQKAAERPLNRFDAPWMGPEDDEEGWRANRERFRVLTEQQIARLQRLLADLDEMEL